MAVLLTFSAKLVSVLPAASITRQGTSKVFGMAFSFANFLSAAKRRAGNDEVFIALLGQEAAEHPEPVSNRAFQSLWELCDQSRSIAATFGAAPGVFILAGLDVRERSAAQLFLMPGTATDSLPAQTLSRRRGLLARDPG